MDNRYDIGRENRITTQGYTEIALEAAAEPRVAGRLHGSISVERGESLQITLLEAQTDTACLCMRTCCSWLTHRVTDFFSRVSGSREITDPVMDESPECPEPVVEMLSAGTGHDQKDEAVQGESLQKYTTSESGSQSLVISGPVSLCAGSDVSSVGSNRDSDSGGNVKGYQQIVMSDPEQSSLNRDEAGAWAKNGLDEFGGEWFWDNAGSVMSLFTGQESEVIVQEPLAES